MPLRNHPRRCIERCRLDDVAVVIRGCEVLLVGPFIAAATHPINRALADEGLVLGRCGAIGGPGGRACGMAVG